MKHYCSKCNNELHVTKVEDCVSVEPCWKCHHDLSVRLLGVAYQKSMQRVTRLSAGYVAGLMQAIAIIQPD